MSENNLGYFRKHLVSSSILLELRSFRFKELSYLMKKKIKAHVLWRRIVRNIETVRTNEVTSIFSDPGRKINTISTHFH